MTSATDGKISLPLSLGDGVDLIPILREVNIDPVTIFENSQTRGLAPPLQDGVVSNDRSAIPRMEMLMARLPDNNLIAKAQTGDEQSLAEVACSIRPHVERQLTRYPVSDEDRRDLLQSTLMQVVRKISSFRGDASFSTWLFRVTANEALMMMRSHRRHRARLVAGMDMEELGAIADAGAANDGVLYAVTNERDARVREALEELPESYKSVVVAHYHHDLGLQEIADRLKITESAVRSRLHRARSKLRNVLANDSATSLAA